MTEIKSFQRCAREVVRRFWHVDVALGFVIEARKISGRKSFSRAAQVFTLTASMFVAFGAIAQSTPGGVESQGGVGQSAAGEVAPNKSEMPQQQKPLSPEEKMSQRFPQPVKVSFLIGLPMLDEKNSTLGDIESVQRTADGKIALVIGYGGFLGIGERPVAVPVELVAMLGHDVAAIDMPSEKFKTAPTWTASMGTPVDPGETVLVALTKRSL